VRRTALEDVEFATLEWLAWYNGSRLLEHYIGLTARVYPALITRSQSRV
jgi:hypothetical protein